MRDQGGMRVSPIKSQEVDGSIEYQSDVQIHDFAGDEPCQRMRQERHHVGELLGLAEPPARHLLQQLLPLCFGLFLRPHASLPSSSSVERVEFGVFGNQRPAHFDCGCGDKSIEWIPLRPIEGASPGSDRAREGSGHGLRLGQERIDARHDFRPFAQARFANDFVDADGTDVDGVRLEDCRLRCLTRV